MIFVRVAAAAEELKFKMRCLGYVDLIYVKQQQPRFGIGAFAMAVLETMRPRKNLSYGPKACFNTLED